MSILDGGPTPVMTCLAERWASSVCGAGSPLAMVTEMCALSTARSAIWLAW